MRHFPCTTLFYAYANAIELLACLLQMYSRYFLWRVSQETRDLWYEMPSENSCVIAETVPCILNRAQSGDFIHQSNSDQHVLVCYYEERQASCCFFCTRASADGTAWLSLIAWKMCHCNIQSL